ncbi:hypothetical protein NE452_16395 [Paeniclostridium sordellii]|uniref:hypothetical protein n=1 Tax=Paraclostridium sordellii TaxID=1505 RepID=UPI00210AA2AA|nr:hypothetical protein [Paeniclostridium sordellii]MCQ4699107.1 hypothetical protein [Paeniclostridium sordellii]
MKKIIILVSLIACSMLFVVGCGSKSVLGKTHEESVKNGLGEEIGTRLVVESNEKDITDKNLIQFYNDVVKNNDYKYITVDLGNGEGIMFNNDNMFIKGKIDKDGMISKTIKMGQIDNDKIKYTEN